MTSQSLLPSPQLRFSDPNGKPYAGGSLSTYQYNTSLPAITWQDPNGQIANSNPIILDSAGGATVYGSGKYRLILRDQFDNLVFDAATESFLGSAAITPVMAPVCAAADLATARRLMGVDDAIQAACSAISLMAGPQGVTGPTGPKGDTGDTGAQGLNATGNLFANANPGYWQDGQTGFMLAFGTAVADAAGLYSITFAKPFSTILASLGTITSNPINMTLRLVSQSPTGCVFWNEDTNNSRGYAYGATWAAFGFVTV